MAGRGEGQTGLRLVRAPRVDAERDAPPVLIGARIRETRKVKGWSLARLSDETGIPQSTLSKFETDNLSLPLDRIFRLADALEVNITDLFDRPSDGSRYAPGRRSISRSGDGRIVEMPTYGRRWLFPDLVQKRMFPVIMQVFARDIGEFGPLLRHEGEEFALVLKGRVRVITDIYEPTVLEEMDGIYIDSRMGHAFLNAGTDEAIIINVGTIGELTNTDNQA